MTAGATAGEDRSTVGGGGHHRIYRLFMLTGSVDDVEIADLERPTPFAQSQRSRVMPLSGRGCVR